MAQYVHSVNHSSRKYQVVPVVLAMVDESGAIRDLPYPNQFGVETTDRIYGIELMINPASIMNNMSKIVNRTQTMTGWLEEHWGEELDSVSFQGSTAAFVNGGTDITSIRLNNNETSPVKRFLRGASDLHGYLGLQNINSPLDAAVGSGVMDSQIGVTTSKRRTTVSYRQFKRVVDLFRANGCMYDDLGFITQRYYIFLSYGAQAYKGYFENIDVTEDAVNPFRFTYNITYKAEETVYSYIKAPGM